MVTLTWFLLFAGVYISRPVQSMYDYANGGTYDVGDVRPSGTADITSTGDPVFANGQLPQDTYGVRTGHEDRKIPSEVDALAKKTAHQENSKHRNPTENTKFRKMQKRQKALRSRLKYFTTALERENLKKSMGKEDNRDIRYDDRHGQDQSGNRYIVPSVQEIGAREEPNQEVVPNVKKDNTESEEDSQAENTAQSDENASTDPPAETTQQPKYATSTPMPPKENNTKGFIQVVNPVSNFIKFSFSGPGRGKNIPRGGVSGNRKGSGEDRVSDAQTGESSSTEREGFRLRVKAKRRGKDRKNRKHRKDRNNRNRGFTKVIARIRNPFGSSRDAESQEASRDEKETRNISGYLRKTWKWLGKVFDSNNDGDCCIRRLLTSCMNR